MLLGQKPPWPAVLIVLGNWALILPVLTSQTTVLINVSCVYADTCFKVNFNVTDDDQSVLLTISNSWIRLTIHTMYEWRQ